MNMAALDTGRFFVVSFPRRRPTDSELYFIQDHAIGGIILFADHCRDIDDLKSWLADFKKSSRYPLIVAVDQEGGRVRRFRQGFPDLEAPRYYGYRRLYDRYTADLARVCEALYEVGVNVNLVPVVDLFDSEKGHVLDSRTFSDDRETVARFAEMTIDIHHSQGLLTCAKHFPGLGRSAGDPHHMLSSVEISEDDFFETELGPFSDAIGHGVDGVMVTHLKADKVDMVPSIVSKRIISGWLKEKLSFAGPVITDDLLMEGAARASSFPQVVVDSFAAGSDMLLFGQKFNKAAEAFDLFAEAIDSGRIERSRFDDAAGRIKRFCKGLMN